MAEPRVDIFTDGACSGNPGPGGWAAILRSGGHEKEMAGGERLTTNNRMELMAVIEALNALKQPSLVTVHTDSRYVMDGLTQWLPRWKANGWKTADKKPVKNADLWRALDEATGATMSSGDGSQGIPAILKTSAPMRSPGRLFQNRFEPIPPRRSPRRISAPAIA